MKLVTFLNPVGVQRIGALFVDEAGEKVVDLNYAYAAFALAVNADPRPQAMADALVPPDMRELFAGDDRSLDAARLAETYVIEMNDPALRGVNGEMLLFRREDVRLLAPIQPTKLWHTAGNFLEHIDEMGEAGFKYEVEKPWIGFYQNTTACIGPDAAIVYPQHLTGEVDYELEICAVIKGVKHKDLTPEDAEKAIGGYLIFNDVTARDIQATEFPNRSYGYSKALDTFCPIGPCIVTLDEIGDVQNLEMNLRVNGELRQQSSTRRMCRSMAQIVSYYSGQGFVGGDLISSGTPAGCAVFHTDPQAWYLKPGDVVECEVEKLGILRNTVVAGEQVR
ncbi:fumarylacetoacetate hydrolase family protein [Marinobacterium sedimentorum]|uniref:fumarylacetoacetate hydrolase family protein n=1 Tax=Marinobacterium sedimentorum TaxID=2927804 RepID=UPI0020C6E9AD|nr:fumarylacetoacetate hydrolase family protein [Marinobacterium sedimentorum]MCP8689888.1 fumarylacetoacetate hydrolase family protein [Marinobacterium sedimentorum]